MSDAQPAEIPAKGDVLPSAPESVAAAKPGKEMNLISAVRASLNYYEDSYKSPEVKARGHSKLTILCFLAVIASIPLMYFLPAGGLIWSLMQDGGLAFGMVLFLSKRFALIKDMRPLHAVATCEMLMAAVVIGWFATVNFQQCMVLGNALWQQLNAPQYAGGSASPRQHGVPRAIDRSGR